jgi:hypothetical protein
LILANKEEVMKLRKEILTVFVTSVLLLFCAAVTPGLARAAILIPHVNVINVTYLSGKTPLGYATWTRISGKNVFNVILYGPDKKKGWNGGHSVIIRIDKNNRVFFQAKTPHSGRNRVVWHEATILPLHQGTGRFVKGLVEYGQAGAWVATYN